MENKDGNTEALNSYMAKVQSGEEQLEHAQDVIMCRLDEIIEDELKPLVKEIDGLDYGLNARELIIEHLENVL